MAKIQTPAELPPVHSVAFLEMTAADRSILRRSVNRAMLEEILGRPAFKRMMAMVKLQANEYMNSLFSGSEIPPTIEKASSREAYFTGLVNALRGVLNLQRVLWDEAAEQEEQEEAQKPGPVEKDPFTDEDITTLLEETT